MIVRAHGAEFSRSYFPMEAGYALIGTCALTAEKLVILRSVDDGLRLRKACMSWLLFLPMLACGSLIYDLRRG